MRIQGPQKPKMCPLRCAALRLLILRFSPSFEKSPISSGTVGGVEFISLRNSSDIEMQGMTPLKNQKSFP